MHINLYDLPDMRVMAVCRHGGMVRYFLCLYTTYERIIETFVDQNGVTPFQIDFMILTDEVWDTFENQYRQNCSSLIEGE